MVANFNDGQGMIIFRRINLSGSGNLIATGTVKGNIYDIGKNIVVTLLKNAGFRVIDMGTDVIADRFVGKLKKRGPRP